MTGVKIADREEDNTWPGDSDDEDEDGDGDGNGLGVGKRKIETVKEGCGCDGTGFLVDNDANPEGSEQIDKGTSDVVVDDVKSIKSTTPAKKSRSSSKSKKKYPSISSSLVPSSLTNSTTFVLAVNLRLPDMHVPTLFEVF